MSENTFIVTYPETPNIFYNQSSYATTVKYLYLNDNIIWPYDKAGGFSLNEDDGSNFKITHSIPGEDQPFVLVASNAPLANNTTLLENTSHISKVVSIDARFGTYRTAVTTIDKINTLDLFTLKEKDGKYAFQVFQHPAFLQLPGGMFSSRKPNVAPEIKYFDYFRINNDRKCLLS